MMSNHEAAMQTAQDSKLEEPFVIVIKSDTIQTHDLEIKITACTACDAVVLAARITALYKDRFKCDPIVEIQP